MKRLAFLTLVLAAANAAAAITYRFDGTTGAGRVTADGPQMRVEFTRGDGVIFRDGAVVTSNDGGRTLTLLDPHAKKPVSLRMDDLLGAVTIRNAKSTARDLGDGGVVEGYPTRKWVVDGSYDVTAGDLTMHFTLHSESWRTEHIAEDAQFKGGDVAGKLLPASVKGFPLKETTTVRSANSVVTTSTKIYDVHVTESTPAVYRVQFDTTKGSFVVQVTRKSRGADRFYELVRSGFYDDSRFFRVRRGFIAQFGISGDPKRNGRWTPIADDPVTQSNARGTLAFATTGPDTRLTQVYINLSDNARLDKDGFAPFGKVVAGMDVVDKLYDGYGEESGGGMRGGKQEPLLRGGNAYLDAHYPKLDKILRAHAVRPYQSGR